MSKGFSINDILGSTKANTPAGQKMQVVMLPAAADFSAVIHKGFLHFLILAI